MNDKMTEYEIYDKCINDDDLSYENLRDGYLRLYSMYADLKANREWACIAYLDALYKFVVKEWERCCEHMRDQKLDRTYVLWSARESCYSAVKNFIEKMYVEIDQNKRR